MYDALLDTLMRNSESVKECFNIPEQSARFDTIPPFLSESRMGVYLDRQFGRLWTHQAQALTALGNGMNVVISTGTASGKSLVFQSLAFHKVLLNPNSRVLVFYPLKALAADQLRGWSTIAEHLGLNETVIGRIDGSVRQSDRDNILRCAKIAIMTPDVCHAWLMSRLARQEVREFVQSLSLLVMDEAHTLEGVFGSNFAFLIRRLIAARNHLSRDDTHLSELQMVAATATIANPGEHMQCLTGSNFTVVSHEDDGAPKSERVVAHLACPEDEEMRILGELHSRILTAGRKGSFITFLDSRQGVEQLARATQERRNDSELSELLVDADVLPYRAGFADADRRRIEERLQSNNLRGVVSTSALELGIDLPGLQVGFNLGVPVTRKAYRQRLGRVGRNGPGAFVIVAPADEFHMYGTTFQEYHEMSVEPSYLYLDNRFMQFAHGRCLVNELEDIGAPSRTPSRVAWPHGFNSMHAAASPRGNRPPEYDAISFLGGDEPHYNYPLRNVGETNFKITYDPLAADGTIGEVNLRQALRECYPGATYLHLAKPYRVFGWKMGAFGSYILVETLIQRGRTTKPQITTWIAASLISPAVLENHVRHSEHGFLAETEMLITEKVIGFKDERGRDHSYEALQQRDPNMKARSRNFRTSGVVLHIDHEWFSSLSVRRIVADRLRDVFVREYSVSPQDISSAATNIRVQTIDAGTIRSKCVVVFDEIYGSLRLTEQLYLNCEHVLERMSDAATAAMENSALNQSDVGRILDVLSTFTVTEIPEVVMNDDVRTGYMLVFTPGSIVCYRSAGQTGQMSTVDVEIIQPTIWDDGRLKYQVKVSQRPGQPPVRRWIDAEKLERSAETDTWDEAWWNCKTEEYEDPPDEED